MGALPQEAALPSQRAVRGSVLGALPEGAAPSRAVCGSVRGAAPQGGAPSRAVRGSVLGAVPQRHGSVLGALPEAPKAASRRQATLQACTEENLEDEAKAPSNPSMKPSLKASCKIALVASAARKLILAARSMKPGGGDRDAGDHHLSHYSETGVLLEQQLLQSPLFRSCCPEFVSAITARMETLKLGSFQEIMKDSALNPMLVMVLRGTVTVMMRDLRIGKLTRGQHFGETLLMGIEQQTKVTLKSEEPTSVGMLTRQDFLAVVANFPAESRWFEGAAAKSVMPDSALSIRALVRTCQLFRDLDPITAKAVDELTLRRVCFPTERLVEEQAISDELFIVVRGRVSIEIAGRAVREQACGPQGDERPGEGKASDLKVTPSGCFGELQLLGVQRTHSATVIAQTVCHVRVLRRSALLRALDVNPDAPAVQELRALMSQGGNPGSEHPEFSINATVDKLKEAAIFRNAGCSTEFLEFLSAHLEVRLHLSGSTLCEEGCADDRGMSLLCRGTAMVIKEGQEVALLTAGSVFGELLAFGFAVQRTCSVVAAETCYVQVLHQSVVVRALELFADQRQVLDRVEGRTGNGSESSTPLGSNDEGNQRRRRDALIEALKHSSFFADLNPGFVEELANVSTDRLYLPGDNIIRAGDRGDSMFIMISGSAAVFASDPTSITKDKEGFADTMVPDASSSLRMPSVVKSRVGTLNPGSISGELAMLGVLSVRTATIEADTICTMWEITQEKGLAIIERYPDAQQRCRQVIVEHLERTVPSRVISLPVLRVFDRKFRTLLCLYCERRAYFPGHAIAREGQQGDRLFVVNLGLALLEKKGISIKTYTAGSHFGTTVMLGIHKVYCGTLVALHTTHLLVFPRAAYLNALQHYPSAQAEKQLRRDELASEAELREAMQRIASRKMMWKRHQTSTDVQTATLTDAEMLAKIFESWRTIVREARQRRRQKEHEMAQYHLGTQQWRSRREEALVRAQARLEGLAHLPPTPRSAPEVPVLRINAAEELASILQGWTVPKPSPYYNLRLWDVLTKSMESPALAEPLLPLLAANPTSRPGTCAHPARTAPAEASAPRPKSEGARRPGPAGPAALSARGPRSP